MLSTLFLSIILMTLFLFIMSIGLLLNNKSLKGSCGNTCDCNIKNKIKCALNIDQNQPN